MDKYEFNTKVEQIKKLVTKGDFTTSMKIADTIDWRRVRNPNLLAMISQVYEKNGEYQEAREILLQAYERAPVGKRLLFKLSELSLRVGNVRDAEDYYREFCDAAPGDPRQNLLRYLILKAKGASSRQLISPLEQYVSTELDERWMYELAELYAAVGERNLCVQMCDKIALMFAFGKYVDKALALKAQYASLTDYQRDLVQNPDKYEAQYKAVEQEFENGALDMYREDEQSPEEHFSGEMLFPDREYQNGSQYADESAGGDSLYGQEYNGREYNDQGYNGREYNGQEYDGRGDHGPSEPAVYRQPAGEAAYSEPVSGFSNEESARKEQGRPVRSMERSTLDEELVANLHQAAAEEQLAREMSRLSRDDVTEEEVLNEHTKKLYDIHRALPPALRQSSGDIDVTEDSSQEMRISEEEPEAGYAEEEETARSARAYGTAWEDEMVTEESVPRFIAIETRTPEKGIEKAIEHLKAYHARNNSHNQTVKITGSKLSSRGVDALAAQLSGRDLIVDEAGDLVGEELGKLLRLMTSDEAGNSVVVFLDNPRQIEELFQNYPQEMELFARIDGEWMPEEESAGGGAAVRQDEGQEREARVEAEPETPEREGKEKERQLYGEEMRGTREQEEVKQEVRVEAEPGTPEREGKEKERRIREVEMRGTREQEKVKREARVEAEPGTPEREGKGKERQIYGEEESEAENYASEEPLTSVEEETQFRGEEEYQPQPRRGEEHQTQPHGEEKRQPQREEKYQLRDEEERQPRGEEERQTRSEEEYRTPGEERQPRGEEKHLDRGYEEVPVGGESFDEGENIPAEEFAERSGQEEEGIPAETPGQGVTGQEIPEPEMQRSEVQGSEVQGQEMPGPERRADDYRQEMDPDSFAEYACEYAARIDCSITGKSMLALYEKVELMEEDGVPLTKENAEAMIEEAADKAEKPSLSRLITGVFSPKYNKEGLLILREEHFI